MFVSKTKVDNAGKTLLQNNVDRDVISGANRILDSWRQSHLAPLTEVTMKLQEWLHILPTDFVIAQRLKRKPQIICKLKRSHPMRLTQMQDIGGCRAIFQSNSELDNARNIIKEKSRHKYFTVISETDYRENGTDTCRYRAVHLVVERNGFKVEIQLRTVVQHAWAEEVERVSIICESPLKEGVGPVEVIEYFCSTSDALNIFEQGNSLPKNAIKDIMYRRVAFDNIVGENRKHLLSGFYVSSKFIKGLQAKERHLKTKGKMRNWLLVFNWKEGRFQGWMQVEADPIKAADQYSYYEKTWKVEEGYEAVLIGAKSIDAIPQTHSHYFGINKYDDYIKQITGQNAYETGIKYEYYIEVVEDKANELIIDSKLKKVTVAISIFNKLYSDISVKEFKGSARLNAIIVSQDLELAALRSIYRFKKEGITKIQFRFNIEFDDISTLIEKRNKRDTVWWEFDLAWHLKHPSGEEFNWKSSGISFEGVPRVG